MFDVSVIICAHNPRANYFRRVLDALRGQTLPIQNWELLIVDNASDERLETAWDISWHPNGRHIFEGKLGTAHARMRGIDEASSDLFIFVDDDNVLDPHYLAESIRISREWPRLGVWGSGLIRPEFELEPPEYLKELVPLVALRNADAAYWSNVMTCIWATPWGAGLCIRTNVARVYRQMSKQFPIQLSRTGKALLTGEDLEMGYVACSMGLGMAIFPDLKVVHLIPKERVTEKYLLNLYEGTLASESYLAYKWRGVMPRNPLTFLGLLDTLANVLSRRGLKRRMYFVQKRAVRMALGIVRAQPIKNGRSAEDIVFDLTTEQRVSVG